MVLGLALSTWLPGLDGLGHEGPQLTDLENLRGSAVSMRDGNHPGSGRFSIDLGALGVETARYRRRFSSFRP
jgi:hypothetical protein